MPLIARQRLGLQEAGYGAMLGLFGAGAVAGALALPVMRHKFGSDRLLAVAALTYGSVYLCLASNLDGWVRLLSMTLAGLSWMTTLTTLNTTAQVHLARSHRARGMAIYLMVFAASMAVGSAFWGRLASSFSLVQVLAIVAAVISVTAFAAWLFPIGNLPSPEQPTSSEQLPSPEQPPGSAGENGEAVATG